MVKLRHIVGSNLKELERTLESVKNSIVIVGVNYVGTNWFIHFLVQDTLSENVSVARELDFQTKELKQIKKEKLK